MSKTMSRSASLSSERSPLLSPQPQSLSLANDDAIPNRPLSPSYLSAQTDYSDTGARAKTPKTASTKAASRIGSESLSPNNTAAYRDLCSATRPSSSSVRRQASYRQLDRDLEAEAEQSNVLPFPSQPDPARPLRPKHYRVKRHMSRAKSFVKRNEGILLLAVAQLFFSTMNFFYKLINLLPPEESKAVTALEIIFIRMSITWIGCIGFMLAAGVPDPFLGPKEVRRLLALRGFVGFFGLFGLYYSLQYLSLADATVITFLGPMATGLLGFVVLREPFTAREALGGIVSLSGVVMIARPAFIFGRDAADSDLDVPVGEETHRIQSNTLVGSLDEQASNAVGKWVRRGLTELLSHSSSPLSHTYNYTSPQPHDGGLEPQGVTEQQRLFAVGLALLGVCGGAGAYITIRAIGRRASATHSVAYFSLYSTLVSAILMWFTGTEFVLPKNPKWVALLICVGVFGLAAQILLAMGLQREKAGRAVSVTYLQIVYASIYQLVFLHIPIQPLSALGMTVILLAAGWVAAGKA